MKEESLQALQKIKGIIWTTLHICILSPRWPGLYLQKEESTKLKQNEVNNLNNLKANNEIKFAMKNCPRKEFLCSFQSHCILQSEFLENFTKLLKNADFTQSLPKKWKEKTLSSLWTTVLPWYPNEIKPVKRKKKKSL